MKRISSELRQLVIDRAGNCCEYCRMALVDRLISFEVDHIIAIKHGGATDFDNLCYACYKCNGFKGPNIASIDPETGQLAPLYNPRTQRWADHFRLKDGEIEPLTPEGRVTVVLLRLNTKDRVKQRLALIELGRYPC